MLLEIQKRMIRTSIFSFSESYEFVMNLLNEYCLPPAKMMKLWIGPKLIITIANPRYIEVCIFTFKIISFRIYTYIHKYMNNIIHFNHQHPLSHVAVRYY